MRVHRPRAEALVPIAGCLRVPGTGVPLLMNDRVDLALAAGLEGVHLGYLASSSHE